MTQHERLKSRVAGCDPLGLAKRTPPGGKQMHDFVRKALGDRAIVAMSVTSVCRVDGLPRIELVNGVLGCLGIGHGTWLSPGGKHGQKKDGGNNYAHRALLCALPRPRFEMGEYTWPRKMPWLMLSALPWAGAVRKACCRRGPAHRPGTALPSCPRASRVPLRWRCRHAPPRCRETPGPVRACCT